MKQLLLAVLFCCTSLTVNAHTKQHQHHERIGYHGMVVFHVPEVGYFASHLPLYVKPHDYQVIYQITFENSSEVQAYFDAGMVTILPEKFDLNLLVEGQSFSLETKIFSGHFERGGKEISSTKVSFSKPILIKQVDNTYRAEHAEFYLTPVSEKLSLAVHKIQSSPSFDAITLKADSAAKSTLLTCQKPESLTQQKIQTAMKNCGLLTQLYIETKDFR